MSDYQKELAIAKHLAHDAGKTILKYFNSATTEQIIKSDRSIVTKADIEINRHVIEVIEAAMPNHSIWGEEESSIKDGAKYTWVCDPVDGTFPFAKGLPLSTFSLALVNSDGDSVLGVIYDPFHDRLFEAVKGNGAFVNGTRIAVSQKADLDGAYIDLEMWYNPNEKSSFDYPADTFFKKGSWPVSYCSAIITGCLVAQGSFDAMIFGHGKPEDIAALSVIVTEAGGKVTDLFGNPQRYDTNIRGAVVSNGLLHDELCEITKKMNYKSKYL